MPTWRADVNDPVVLIEDVARMVGYDQIPVAPQPSMPSVGLRVMTDRLRQVVSEHLVSAGFYECRNPSLESPKMSAWLGDASDSITLSNWATREMSVLRRTLAVGPGGHGANQRSPRSASRSGFSRSTDSSVVAGPSPMTAVR